MKTIETICAMPMWFGWCKCRCKN